MDDIERQWAALNGDQGTSNGSNLVLNDRQILQREQDHFGFIVLGSDMVSDEAGTIIDGVNLDVRREPAPDIKLRIIGPSSPEEWRAHALFNYGPEWLPAFDHFVQLHRCFLRAIAE